jgi:hypothetical protein
MGMWAYIGILSFMGIAFFVIGLGTYIYMKRTVSGEKNLMEEVVNEQTRTSKLEFHEILRYVILIFGAVIFLFYMVYGAKIRFRVHTPGHFYGYTFARSPV